MFKIKKLLLLIFCCHLFAEKIFATEQYGDRLIVNNDTSWIEATPLEDYLENKGSRLFGEILLEGDCTALWRGYVATWKIMNDSLFLVKLQLDYCSENPTNYELVKEFNKEVVFAYWTNRTIRKPEGRFIQHGYYYDSIHEGESLYSFEKGILMRQNKYSFIGNTAGLIFPGEEFLIDTIRSLILNEISDAELELFDESTITEIGVNFTRSGELLKIELIDNDKNYTKDQKNLLAIAKKVLQDFPKLMPVYHPRFEPQFARVNIIGFCLRKKLYKNGKCDKY